MTYVLHYAPDNASLVVRLALEALDVPYTTHLVDRRARGQHSVSYRAINPAGRIPTLETPDGPIFETAAILLWLADRHDALAPAATTADRGRFLSWLMFVSNDVQTPMRFGFYAERFAETGSGHGAQDLQRAVESVLNDSFAKLDAACSGPFFLGQTLSVLDLYLAPFLRWSVIFPVGAPGWFRLDAYPNLYRMAEMLEECRCVQRACAAEGLGARPFTAPQPATPPEGSAT